MASTVLGDSRAQASVIVRPTEEKSLSDIEVIKKRFRTVPIAELAVLQIQKYTRLHKSETYK